MLRRPSRSSARLETRQTAVFDASALVRALHAEDEAAQRWLDAAVTRHVTGLVPEIAFAEVANAFSVYARAGQADSSVLRRALRDLVELPLGVVSLRNLVEAAFDAADQLGLTVYDACYAVLAHSRGAVLVTADRRLAAVVPRSALLPAAAPPA